MSPLRRTCTVMAAAVALAGCGGGSSGASPDSFVRGLLSAVAGGNYGRYYDALYPSQQRLISYDDYFRCVSTAVLMVKAFGIDASTLRVEKTITRPGTSMVGVPGTGERAAAVTVTVYASLVEGRKRAEKGPVDAHVVRVDGQWRVIDGKDFRTAGRKDCGIGLGPTSTPSNTTTVEIGPVPFVQGIEESVAIAKTLTLDPVSALGQHPFTPNVVPHIGTPLNSLNIPKNLRSKIPAQMIGSNTPTSISNAQLARKLAPVYAGLLRGLNPFVGAPSPLKLPLGSLSLGQGKAIQVDGFKPGLYGGTQLLTVCDKKAMIAFLLAHRDKLDAWAAAQGISPDAVAAYINRLTDVVLQLDTRVTNHGFSNGTAYPIDEVLQAGTAVLVDEYGIPRARCYCGNPLTPPRALASSVKVVGKPWPGFSLGKTIVVKKSKKAPEFGTIDIVTGSTAVYKLPGTLPQNSTLAPTLIAPLLSLPTPTATTPTETTGEVPNVRGNTLADAVRALTQAGLNYREFDVPSSQAPGTVTGQSPAAGTVAVKGTTIRINVSKGLPPIIVPADVIGKTEQAATAELEQMSFSVGPTQQQDSPKPQGQVTDTNPLPGTLVKRGSQVTLIVSKGPQLAPVPDVTGFPVATAVTAIRNAGFKAVVATQTTSDKTQDGIVISESPQQNTLVTLGTPVTITVGATP